MSRDTNRLRKAFTKVLKEARVGTRRRILLRGTTCTVDDMADVPAGLLVELLEAVKETLSATPNPESTAR